MTDPPTYLLDANVFIQAARHYYAFDIAPAFWQALLTQAADRRVRSIDRVKDEIDEGKDELTQWASDRFHEWFESTDQEDVVHAYGQVMAWAQGQAQFTDAAKADFASKADGWLIAYAKAKGCVVVTHEQFDANVRRKVPIPNVCRAFDFSPVDTLSTHSRCPVTWECG